MSELSPLAAARHLATLAMVVIAAMTMPAAWAQSPPAPAAKTVIIQVAPAPEPVAPAPVAPAPLPVIPEQPLQSVPRENPGLLNELGKMLSAPTWSLPALPVLPSLGLPSDTNDALPKINTMVKGRMVCPVASNGAPDCKAGSDKLCQSKGFKEGKSLDTDSAVSCSSKSMLGAKKLDDICKTENYVTRALCQ